MRRQKEVDKLAKIIKPYGLSIVVSKGKSGHRHVINAAGEYVDTMSNTPRCQYFAQNELKRLIKLGAVPEAARQALKQGKL